MNRTEKLNNLRGTTFRHRSWGPVTITGIEDRPREHVLIHVTINNTELAEGRPFRTLCCNSQTKSILRDLIKVAPADLWVEAPDNYTPQTSLVTRQPSPLAQVGHVLGSDLDHRALDVECMETDFNTDEQRPMLRMLMEDSDLRVMTDDNNRITKVLRRRNPEFAQGTLKHFICDADGNKHPIEEEDMNELLGFQDNPEDFFHALDRAPLEGINLDHAEQGLNNPEDELAEGGVHFESSFAAPMDRWDVVFDATAALQEWNMLTSRDKLAMTAEQWDNLPEELQELSKRPPSGARIGDELPSRWDRMNGEKRQIEMDRIWGQWNSPHYPIPSLRDLNFAQQQVVYKQRLCGLVYTSDIFPLKPYKGLRTKQAKDIAGWLDTGTCTKQEMGRGSRLDDDNSDWVAGKVQKEINKAHADFRDQMRVGPLPLDNLKKHTRRMTKLYTRLQDLRLSEMQTLRSETTMSRRINQGLSLARESMDIISSPKTDRLETLKRMSDCRDLLDKINREYRPNENGSEFVLAGERNQLWHLWQLSQNRANGEVDLQPWQYVRALRAKLFRQDIETEEVQNRVYAAMKKHYGTGVAERYSNIEDTQKPAEFVPHPDLLKEIPMEEGEEEYLATEMDMVVADIATDSPFWNQTSFLFTEEQE
jgi:hypothetical protein